MFFPNETIFYFQSSIFLIIGICIDVKTVITSLSVFDLTPNLSKDLSMYHRRCVLLDCTYTHFAQHKSKTFGRHKMSKVIQKPCFSFSKHVDDKIDVRDTFQRSKSKHAQTHGERERGRERERERETSSKNGIFNVLFETFLIL